MDDYSDNGENSSYTYASQLRQPSKIPSPNKGLYEMTASATNARVTNMMPPPDTVSHKHKISGLPEPAPKRKTLAERAGEIPRPNGTTSSLSRSISQMKGTSLMSRNQSFSSSVSSRTPSTSSRHISSNSFANSMGPGTRPPSSSGRRPQTAMGNGRSGMPLPSQASRPASAMDTDFAPLDKSALGKRKGMSPFSLSTSRGQRTQDCTAAMRPCRKATQTKTLVLKSLRDISLTSAMSQLTLESKRPSPPTSGDSIEPSPSLIPKPSPRPIQLGLSLPMTPSKAIKNKSSKRVPFLTRDSNLVWDTKGRLEDMEYLYSELKDKMSGTTSQRNVLEESVGVYKARINELEAIRTQLASNNSTLTKNLHDTEIRITAANTALDNERGEFEAELRSYAAQMDDIGRQHRNELDDAERKGRDSSDRAKREAREELDIAKRDARDEVDRLLKKHNDDLRELERRLKGDLEDERAQRVREVQQVTSELAIERQKANAVNDSKEQEARNARDELDRAQGAIETKEMLLKNLRAELSETSAKLLTVESSCRAQKARIDFLESDSSAQAQSFADAEQQMQDAISMAEEFKAKLRKEESLRRKLHNQVQELKGNIRVFCRIRPSLDSDSSDTKAKIAYPDEDKDSKEVEVHGPEEKSSLGNVTTKKNAFSFDRVFAPGSQNEEVFEEISQLVQSALDGYNVCIFCYGQTGSGKTYTMSAPDGMIPRAVNQIYETALSLEEKGWKYTMEGSFVEVYNENINDLLGRADEFDKKKHDIHHDMQRRKTTITNLTTELLDCPGKVETILKKASNNRSVAATKANERSSRSHSVFILKLKGENRATGESSEGTLNLVDLAGSERLSQSQATGERLKETQNINKSLSSLGDVIGALGQGKDGAHIPYRNSKLTYLLQFSLGGNSKTLMFVMISPLQAHLGETLTSLKFATKVHNTHIGTAKKQSRVRES